MRTTVELPPELMRAAKARSAESGESLKTLLTRALAAELGGHPTRSIRRTHVVLPLFGTSSDPRANPSSADLQRALADADASSIASTGPRPRRPRTRR